MKKLAELGRTALKINTEIQKFKYLQKFAFIEKDRYIFKAFQEANSDYKWMGKTYENKTGDFVAVSSYGKYMGNMHEVKSGKIFKEKHRSKMSFFRNKQLIATYKISFTNT